MNVPLMGFIAFLFAGFTALNRILEGQFITTADVSIVNNLTIFRSVELFGGWSVPMPNLEFFKTGIPALIKWDYTFFGGNAGIIQFFLYSISAAVLFGLIILTIGLLYQFFNRTR